MITAGKKIAPRASTAVRCISSTSIDALFGVNSFNLKAQRELLPKSTYARIAKAAQTQQPISSDDAEVVAAAVQSWALERGATHYTHWFQPLTGKTAEKHDSFLKRENGGAISSFTGKQLLLGEPDASSFPSGGLRETHLARGNTVWDPASPPFIADHGNGQTLFIPTGFFGWTGYSQDEKIPLLRANAALQTSALKLLRAAGDNRHTSVHTDSGLEQEFFLMDRELFQQRPDLMTAGRTVLGCAPPKGQEMSDHYFASMSDRMLSVLNDTERELWKIGIAATTRHREVAPGQYEMAPMFAPASAATDANLMLQTLVHKTARKHGVAATFHEKPFADMNGSGKHNNWSMGTNCIPTLFQPGPNPETNTSFLLALAATVRAVDKYGDLLRWAISGAGNDHRLGGHEAPPAIVSMYLGDDLQAIVDHLLSGTPKPDINTAVDLGGVLPLVHKEPTDRNRTSPFAFTGNKFEFRAVGSSQNPSRSCYTLTAMVADSMEWMADEVTAAGGGDNAALQVATAVLRDHSRVIFNGDNYSSNWVTEAERRGLPNLRNTSLVLDAIEQSESGAMLARTGVLSPEEFASRVEVDREKYAMDVNVEGELVTSLASTRVLPAALDYQASMATSLAAVSAGEAQQQRLSSLTSSINGLCAGMETLGAELSNASDHADYRNKVLPAMAEVRQHADALEQVVPAEKWTLPTYHDMLYRQD